MCAIIPSQKQINKWLEDEGTGSQAKWSFNTDPEKDSVTISASLNINIINARRLNFKVRELTKNDDASIKTGIISLAEQLKKKIYETLAQIDDSAQ